MKLRKLLAMGLAAVMAVSAMSVSAFAKEDEVVASFLAADGVSRIYLTQEDIDNGNNSVVGYDGIIFEVEEVSNNIAPLYQRAANSYDDFTINRTSVPSSSYMSVSKTEVFGSFNIAAAATKYSSCLFQSGSSTNVMLTINPGMNLERNVDFSLYSKGTTDRWLASVAPGSTTMIATARNVKNYTLYAKAENGLDSSATGTATVRGSSN